MPRLPQSPSLNPAPTITWPQFRQRLQADPDWRRQFRNGDHALLLGENGCGKTHMALAIDDIPRPSGPRYTIFLAAKRTDPLLDQLPEKGWYTARDLRLEYVDGKPRHNKIVYRPVISPKLPIKEQNDIQARKMRDVIGMIYKDGKWTVICDELVWLDAKLKLRDDIETVLFKGRTEGISIIACAQRPAWITRFVYSQSDHIFIWNTNDREDRKSLADISGVDRNQAIEVVQSLDTSKHEAAYICTRTSEIMRVVAPPR